MVDIVRTCNTYEVGSLAANVGVMTRMPQALYEVPGRDYVGVQRWWYYPTKDHVQYNAKTNAMELQQVLLDNADMVLSEFVQNSGEFTTCEVPFGNVKYYIKTVNHAANVWTSISTKFLIKEEPHFKVSFVRDLQSPRAQIDDQLWEIHFGGGYVLRFSRTSYPAMYRDGERIYVQALDENAFVEYATQFFFSVTIQNVYGNLYVRSNNFIGDFMLEGVGVLASDQITITCTGGGYAFNLAQCAYPASGHFITDWIEIGGDTTMYPDGDMQGSVFPPTLPTGCTATVSVAEADGTKRRFRVDVTSDGRYTPHIQAFECRWDATYSNPGAADLLDITPWVKEGARESFSEDNGTRSLDFTLLPGKVVSGDTLTDAVGELSGDLILRWKVGYVYADGTTDQQTRGVGVIRKKDWGRALYEVDEYRMTVHDRWDRLAQTDLLAAPCCAGMRVDQAIALIAAWAGIAPTEMSITPIYKYLDADNGVLITDWTNPVWHPTNGTKASEFIKKICDDYGVIAEFAPTGLFVVRDKFAETSVVDSFAYVTSSGVTPRASLDSVSVSEERTSITNTVIVEGQGHDGFPIFGMLVDDDSVNTPGSPRYIGHYAIEYAREPDLKTQESVNIATVKRYLDRKAGWLAYRITSVVSDLWKCWPLDVITLVLDEGSVNVTIVDISTTHGHTLNETTVTAELRLGV
jgi:hypothetical protein